MKDFLKAEIYYFFCSHRQFRSTILTDSSSLYSLSPPSVPPAPPTLYVQGSSRDALTLRWSLRPHHALVRGYILNYKREYGNWEEVRFHTRFMLFGVGGGAIRCLFAVCAVLRSHFFIIVVLRRRKCDPVCLHLLLSLCVRSWDLGCVYIFCCAFVGGGVIVSLFTVFVVCVKGSRSLRVCLRFSLR